MKIKSKAEDDPERNAADFHRIESEHAVYGVGRDQDDVHDAVDESRDENRQDDLVSLAGRAGRPRSCAIQTATATTTRVPMIAWRAIPG